MQHTRKLAIVSCFAALLGFQQSASAATCFEDGSNCTLKGKWYAGFEFGEGETQMTKTAVSRFFDSTGLDRGDVNIDDDDHSNAFLIGYHFTENLAVEASYRDLGERSVTFSGPSASRGLFENNAGAIFPESGEGFTLGAIASWPLTPRWKLSGKLGIMRWEQDTQQSNGVVLGRNATDGSDFWYGVETSYMFTPRIQSYIGFTRFNFDRDEVDVLGLGVRFYFGGKEEAKVAPKTEQLAAPTTYQPAPAPRPVEGDADRDGVVDSKDKCADTPSNHLVDGDGCTRYKPVNYEHELTIYYPNNSSEINPSYMAKIDALVNFAKEHNIKLFKIIGHTSAPGEMDYNQWLSERRADSLAKILKDKYGYSANQIDTLGLGETSLAVAGNTESAHSKNRRLEVQLSASGRVPMLKQ